MRIYTVLLSLLIFWNVSANAQIYHWVDENGKKIYSDKPRELPAQRSLTSNKNVSSLESNVSAATALNPHSELITPKVRSLFQRRDYKSVELLLNQLKKQVELDITQEYLLLAAYNAFTTSGNDELVSLSKWIQLDPESHIPYLARAHHYASLGWKARGKAWRSETSEAQFSSMREYFTLAIKDLDKALKIQPSAMPAYVLLIKMASAMGEDRSQDLLMKKALTIAPASYEIRRAHIWHLAPRWGGSYGLMDQYALSASNQYSKNPKLKLLKGYKLFDQARIKRSARAFSIAEDLCTKGLEYGPNPELFFERAKSKYYRDNYSSALSDLSHAIALNPENPDYYYWRALSSKRLGQLSDAVVDVNLVLSLEPDHERVQTLRNNLAKSYERKGYDAGKQHQHQNALAFYQAALSLTPENSTLFFRKAHTLIKLNRFDEAIESVKKSIEHNPSYFEAYRLLDYLLAKNNDWETIIRYWDQYIRLDPMNGSAYTERGGAYFHKGDIKQAVENARLAAELGDADGKAAYEKYRHRVE